MILNELYYWTTSVYIWQGLSLFGIAINMALLTMHISSIAYSKFIMNQKPPDLPSNKVEGVSILKPLKGVDPNLEKNLETFFNLKYPKYEIFFCIHDDDDPANEIVKKLISKYPKVNARLITGGKRVGPNPKINNLLPAYNVMKYNLFWICDAGIKVLPLTLNDLVSHMTENVALVHAAPCTANRKGFASALEKVYFGTQHSRVYISANVMGLVCSTGMSNLIRRDYFEKAVGGLEKLSVYIAEDYFMSKLLFDYGFKLALASYPALQNSGNKTIYGFINRMIRWTKLRISMIPLTAMLEPFSECFISSVIFSGSCWYLFSWNMALVFSCRILLWITLDYILIVQLENGNLKLSMWKFLTAWFFRETLTPYIMSKAFMDPTIHWRTGKFRLKYGGKVEESVDV